MCGSGNCNSKHGGVVIPRQNKDVCRECDKSIWRHDESGARVLPRRPVRIPVFAVIPPQNCRYFKWCKGCKNFLQIGNFNQKLDAAKCDRCRERGRTSYLLKKRTVGTATKAKDPKKLNVVEADCGPASSDAAISLVALAMNAELATPAAPEAAAAAAAAAALPGDGEDDDGDARMSSNFGCSLLQYQRKRSRSESCSDGESAAARVENDDEPASSPEAGADKGMLFELANIHATIITLEQRAALVEPLERRVADLEADLESSRGREASLAAELRAATGAPPLTGAADKRPRLISFDDAALAAPSPLEAFAAAAAAATAARPASR